MRLFYVALPERIKEIKHGCHWLALGDSTHLLVGVDWKDEHHEMEWSNKPGVIRLPHPIFEANMTLDDAHLQHLAKRFPVRAGHTIHDMLKHAAKDDPWMRLHVL